MAGPGIAIYSYNMLGIWMYVGQLDQTNSQSSIKNLKTQHNLATSGSQLYMGAKPPYPVESTTVTGSSTVLSIHFVKEPLYFKLKYQRHGHTN